MPLPAPYAPPWKRLGEDLVATAAWLGLKARELWRRNREGSLPVPGFWPRRWPGLFWPGLMALVLVAALALARVGLAGGVGAGSDRGRGELTAGLDLGGAPSPSVPGGHLVLAPGGPPTETPGAIAPDGTETKGAEGAEGAKGAEGAASQAPLDGDGEAAAPLDSPLDSPVAPPPEQATDGDTPGDTAGDTPGETAGETATDLDRLREVLQADAPDGPILGLIADPAAATLTLDLAESFLALPPAQRQQRAEQWQQAAASEGYGHLCLRDGSGRPLGRDALVGGGMILLEPPRAGRSTP